MVRRRHFARKWISCVHCLCTESRQKAISKYPGFLAQQHREAITNQESGSFLSREGMQGIGGAGDDARASSAGTAARPTMDSLAFQGGADGAEGGVGF